MTPFTTRLVVEPLDDGRNWRVYQEFDYETRLEPMRWRLPVLRIPAGFVTDFASIPQALWNILPPAGAYARAAVVHDFLYRTRGLATRAEADGVFLEAMGELRVSWRRRHAMWLGVRIFGGRAFRAGQLRTQ